jgi:ATP-binding cassette subfamily B protein
VKVTQAFTREEINAGIFDGLLAESRKYKLYSAYIGHGMWPVSAFLSRIVKAAAFAAAVYLFRSDFITDGVVQIGAITAMVSYSNRFWGQYSSSAWSTTSLWTP